MGGGIFGWIPDLSKFKLSDVPGAILNIGLEPAHLIVQGVGLLQQGIGQVTHHKDIENAGRALAAGDNNAGKVIQKHPIESAEVVGGAAVAVAGVLTGGVVSTAGVGLAIKGIAGLTQAMLANGGAPLIRGDDANQTTGVQYVAPKTTATSAIGIHAVNSGAPVPVTLVPTQQGSVLNGVEHPSLWADFVHWIDHLLGIGAGT